MDRRTFLKGIIASSALPVFARGPTQQLNLAMVKIEVGASRPFSALHISDTHLALVNSEDDELKRKIAKEADEEFGYRQLEALDASLAWAKRYSDYLFHTGDLIDFITMGNLDAVGKRFGAHNAFHGCIGNHEFSPYKWYKLPEDKTEHGKAEVSPLLRKYYPFDLKFSSRIINGVNFISMDDVWHSVTPEQIAAFKREAARGMPIILMMHEPFLTPKILQLNAKVWSGKKFTGQTYGEWKPPEPLKSFVEYLKKEPLLKGILCGHLHCFHQERFSETAVQYVVGGNYGFAGQEVLFV